MDRPLTADEIEAVAAELEGWRADGNRLCRTYEFADFTEAIGFMVRAAIWAERLDHHPDWSNTYRTVRVELTTHDLGGISHLDVELATKMNQLARV